MGRRHLVWRSAVGATAVLATAGTLLILPLAGVIGIGVAMALFGGVMGLAFKPDLPRVAHPVLGRAALSMGAALYPGLSQVLGDAAVGVVALLCVTSPPVVTRLRRAMRGPLGRVHLARAATASHHEALRLQWEASSRQLQDAASTRDRMLLVQLRERILDDVVAASDGAYPEWLRVGDSTSSGDGRQSRPSRDGSSGD